MEKTKVERSRRLSQEAGGRAAVKGGGGGGHLKELCYMQQHFPVCTTTYVDCCTQSRFVDVIEFADQWYVRDPF